MYFEIYSTLYKVVIVFGPPIPEHLLKFDDYSVLFISIYVTLMKFKVPSN